VYSIITIQFLEGPFESVRLEKAGVFSINQPDQRYLGRTGGESDLSAAKKKEICGAIRDPMAYGPAALRGDIG